MSTGSQEERASLLNRMAVLEVLKLSELEQLLAGSVEAAKAEPLSVEECDRKIADEKFMAKIADPKLRTAVVEQRSKALAQEQEEQRAVRDYNVSQLGRKRTLFAQYSLMHDRIAQVNYMLGNK